jgi:hypothetical protein
MSGRLAGLPQLVIIPFVPLLMRHVDARLITICGLAVFAFSCFMNAHLSPDYSGDQLWLPNIVRALGQAVILTPLSAITMTGIAKQDSAGASGLFNMARNLGGAFGTALLATLVTKREQFHSNVIGSLVNLFRDSVRERLAELQLLPSLRGQRHGHGATKSNRHARKHSAQAGADHGLCRHVRSTCAATAPGRGISVIH